MGAAPLLALRLLHLRPPADRGPRQPRPARRYRLPKRLVAHMAVNQAIDACVGVVPFLGDIFDFS